MLVIYYSALKECFRLSKKVKAEVELKISEAKNSREYEKVPDSETENYENSVHQTPLWHFAKNKLVQAMFR